MLTKSLPIKALCLVLILALAGCTQAQILTDLDVAAGAIAAVALVPGIPAPYNTFLSQTATALDCVAAVVEKGGTNAQVATAIASCGLTAVAPNLPPGAPTTIVAAITAVVSAVEKVVADVTSISSAQANPASSAYATAFFAGPNGGKQFKPGHGAAGKIKKIRKTLADAKAKLPVKK